jgi:lipopolysaccharide biosynthesis glycosyltransferase
MLRNSIQSLIKKVSSKFNREPSLSFYIPVSPHPKFYSRVKWIRKSLDYLGTPYSKAIIHLTIGNEKDISIEQILGGFAEFSSHQHRYRFHVADKEKFEKYNWLETGATRFKVIDEADIIIHCDADIIFVKRFDDLLSKVISSRGIYGVIAHSSPFSSLDIQPIQMWKLLSLKFCNKEIELKHMHSKQAWISCPAYYNNGFVIGDHESWQKIKIFFYQNFSEVFDVLSQGKDPNHSPGFFSLQISLALALFKYDIRTQPLPEIYNFANDEVLIQKYESQVSDVKIIHYLRKKFFDRDYIFRDNDQTDRFLTLQNLDPISKILQQHIAQIIEDQGYD